MKIICIGQNYAVHNKAGDGALLNTESPVLFLKPDSALQRCNKPFFVPDELGRIDFGAALVVRICRLGKGIPQRFANRYYDAVTVGVDFTAYDLLQQARKGGQPWDLSKGFDASAVVGEWLPTNVLCPDAVRLGLAFRLERNGQTVQTGFTGDMQWNVDALIAYCSQFFTLKTGDLIFTGTPEQTEPVSIGDQLTGWIEDRKVTEVRCK